MKANNKERMKNVCFWLEMKFRKDHLRRKRDHHENIRELYNLIYIIRETERLKHMPQAGNTGERLS